MPFKRAEPPPLPELKKGTVLVLKVPPYFTKEYLYEITSAGEKLIRANLYRSAKVRKQWSKEELQALFNNEIARLADERDMKSLGGPIAPAPGEPG